MNHEQHELLGYWLRRFLSEYVATVKNFSANTLRSYRDAFRLLLNYATVRKINVEEMKVVDLTEEFVIGYLESLESTRHCSTQTRNLRLAAICSFARYLSHHSPEHVNWSRAIRDIPAKKGRSREVTYLEKPEMDALLQAPDRTSRQGQFDYALLLFLYNTGARADEAASVLIKDIQMSSSRDLTSVVSITGKGRKTRLCPLWKTTCDTIKKLIAGRGNDEHVFINRRGEPITRFGVYEMVKRNLKRAQESVPSIKKKRVSPHTIRHTTATHLVIAGVDINTVRAWLGHVSVNTTNVYAEINMKMKAAALEKCMPKNQRTSKHWRDDGKLMQFLDGIR